MTHIKMIATFIGHICALATSVAAQPSEICRQAAADVAATSNVPFAVLLAITQTETGRTNNGITEPWAWAVNLNGAGHWFDTRTEAYAFARQALSRNQRSFDVGCFQINYRWHHENFASLDAMFDPLINGQYAAQFLSDLYRETGSWSQAAGTYHSRTEVYATRYRARFDAFYAAAQNDPSEPTRQQSRQNTFGLLQPGSTAQTLGSLVPLRKGLAH